MKRILFFLLLFSSFANAQIGEAYTRRIFNVMDYGAVPDSSTDNAAAFTRAKNAARQFPGSKIYVPTGKWGLNSTFTIDTSNLVLYGDGPGTILQALSDYGNIIALVPTTNPPTVANFFHDVGVYSLSIQSSVARTSGSAIYTTYTHSCTVKDVVIGHIRTLTAPNTGLTNFLDGVHFENESNALLSNTQIYAWHCGVYFTGKSVGTPYYNTNNFDGTIDQNCFIVGDSSKSHVADTTYAVHIAGGAGGILMEHSNSSFYSEGVHIDPAFGINNNIFIGQDFAADLCGSHGIHATPNSFASLTMTGGWSSSAGSTFGGTANGLYIESPQTGGGSVTITGGDIFGATGYGVRMEAGKLTAVGIDFQPGSAPQNTSGDIYLGSGVTAAVITGCYAPKGLTNAGTLIPNQWNNYGIQLSQYSFPTAQISLNGSSATGGSQLYLSNNISNHYLTAQTNGSTVTGNFALGFPNADLSYVLATGTTALMLGTSSIKPIVFATNATGSIGPEGKVDSNAFYILASATNKVPLIMRGIASQTADYININDAASATKFKIDVSGNTTVGGIVGTTTNNSASAGNVGEYVTSLVAIGSPVSLSTTVASNVTSISLTAGDWDVDGQVSFTEGTSTVTARSAGVTITTGTVPTDGSEGYCGVQSTVTSEINSISLVKKRFSLSTTTTIFLVGKATFTAGTCGGFGVITARRVR